MRKKYFYYLLFFFFVVFRIAISSDFFLPDNIAMQDEIRFIIYHQPRNGRNETSFISCFLDFSRVYRIGCAIIPA